MSRPPLRDGPSLASLNVTYGQARFVFDASGYVREISFYDSFRTQPRPVQLFRLQFTWISGAGGDMNLSGINRLSGLG